jgi:hypothetical protein
MMIATSARPSRRNRGCSPTSHSSVSTGTAPGAVPVGVEESLEQPVGGAGLGDQHQALAHRRAPGAPGGRRRGVEDRAPLGEHLTGRGEGHAVAVALQQPHPEAALRLLDRPAERRLGHPRRWAARPKCRSSATATKHRSSRSSTSSTPQR